MITSPGQLLVNDALPEDLRRPHWQLDKKGVTELFSRVAERHPDQYRDIAQKLMSGGHFAAQSAGTTIKLRDLLPPPEVEQKLQDLRNRVQTVADQNLPNEQKEKLIVDTVLKHSDGLEKLLMEHGLASGNSLATQVASGSRGNPTQFKQLVAGDMLVADHRNRVIPVPVLRGYANGVEPAEYFAAAYGARRGTISTKFATQRAGFLGKQLAMIAHRLVVSEKDCGTSTGLPVEGGDKDNLGAVLAHDAGGHKAGTIISADMLADLKGKKILVRSPTTCQSSRGVCAKCVGVREKGHLPDVGENVGMAAAQAVSEPLAQSSLCLAKGTLVRMADSTEQAIEDIKPGDWVLGADVQGRAFPVKVLRQFDNGLKACYRTTFRIGTQHDAEAVQLTSTLDHKILATTWYSNCHSERYNNTARVLPVGFKNKRLSAVYPSSTRFNCTFKEPRALLLGLLLGDGCYTKSVGRPYFSCDDPQLIQELTPYLQAMNLQLGFHKGSKCYWRVSQIKDTINQDPKTGRVVAGSRNPAKLLLQYYGIDEKYAHEKEIPSQLFKADDATIADLIAGLWITDGSLYLTERGRRLHLGFTSTSPVLVRQMKWLLQWRFGIYSAAVHFSPMSQNKTRKHDVYSFAIARQDAVKRFIEKIPLRGVKAEKARMWADRLINENALQHQRGARTSQTFVGNLPTFDIEVEHPDHLFVLANGLIVSNSEKHSGGAVTKRAADTSGFDYINRLIQTPKQFSGSAVVANKSGRITEISDAPQGGKFIYVDNEKHYVPPGEVLQVKPGDKLDAGDLLSDGIPNPADIVAHKGIGEGRRSFTQILYKALADSGIKAHRRNVELISRGLINHVKWSGEDAENHVLPDDVVPYDNVTRSYRPRVDAKTVDPSRALDMHLEHPVLHYSIGTKITPRVAGELKEFGVTQVVAHLEPPPFTPTMVHGREVGLRDPNWITRMGSSYLQKGFLEGVHRARKAPTSDTSFYPSLAKVKGFGSDLSSSGTY